MFRWQLSITQWSVFLGFCTA